MPSYVIFIREGEIVDPEMMAAYKAAGTGQSTGNAKPLAVYGAMEALEGDLPDGVVILEFPSTEEARAWYNGPYHARAQMRQKAAPYRGFIVEGF